MKRVTDKLMTNIRGFSFILIAITIAALALSCQKTEEPKEKSPKVEEQAIAPSEPAAKRNEAEQRTRYSEDIESPQPSATPGADFEKTTVEVAAEQVTGEQEPQQASSEPEAAEFVDTRPPLERAKGKKIIWEDGEPLYVWNSVEFMPRLDEIFTGQKEQPEDFLLQATDDVKRIELHETEERKRLRENVIDEFRDKLYAVMSPNGKCVVEFYGGTTKEGREDWIRGIDPKTKEVLWKHEEPYLYEPEATIVFASDTERFILTDVLTKDRKFSAVKLFSCKEGFIRTVYLHDEEKGWHPSPMGQILPDGGEILIFDRNSITLLNDYVAGEFGDEIWWYGEEEYRILDNDISKNSAYLISLMIEEDANSPTRMWKYILSDLTIKTGEILKWESRTFVNFGDTDFNPTNHSVKASTNNTMNGIWFMDPEYIDYIEGQRTKKAGKYGNIAVLFDSNGQPYAFRIKSIGFALSDNGKYVYADGTYFNISSIWKEKKE